MYETWIYNNTRKIKQESKLRVSLGKSTPKNAKWQFFWMHMELSALVTVVLSRYAEIHWVLDQWPPFKLYSLSLTSSDQLQFPILKKCPHEKRNGFNDEIIAWTNVYFKDFDKSY